MRLLAFIVLLFGVAFAGGAVFYAKQFFDAQAVRVSSQTETVRLLAAKQRLEPGDVLRPEHLGWVEVPRALVPEGAFSSPEALLGEEEGDRRWVLRAMEKGEPILRGKLTELNEPSRLPDNLPPGMGAISFRIDAETGVSGFVAPGDRVIILLTRQTEGDLVSSVLLHDVLILAIDQVKDTETASPRVARTVTVAVTTEQAQKIAIARETGRLSLLLRGLDAEPDEKVRPFHRDELDDLPRTPEKPQKGIWLRKGDERIFVPFD